MTHDNIQQLEKMSGTLGRAFLASVITILLSAKTGIIPLNMDIVKAALNAGVGSVLVVLLNWLNPNDTRYGNGHESQ